MHRLRKILFGFFPLITAIYVMAAIGTTAALFRPLGVDESQSPHWARTPLQEMLAVLLLALARLIFAIPIVIATLYGMSWWMVLKGKPSARPWVIAASIAMILQTVPGWALVIAISRYSHGGIPLMIWALNLGGLAFGVAGLVAFGPRNSMAAETRPTKPPANSRRWNKPAA